METEYIDENGRKYLVIEEGEDHRLIIGPPEGLVDMLGLPEPFATNLHNALFRRKLYNMTEVNKRSAELQGALQECYALDVQKLHEAFFRYENGGLT